MTRRARAVALATMLVGCTAPALPVQVWAGQVTIKESGSALMQSLFREWARRYAEVHPDVTITTAETSSHQGIFDAFSNAAQIGVSDTFLSDEEVDTHPGFLNIALATSALAIAYNLPGIQAPLKLDGPTLAAIFDGTIQSWDNKAIAELNPDLVLPHHAIVPMRLARSASETSILAQYLAAAETAREDGSDAMLDTPEGASSDRPALRRSDLRTRIAWVPIDGARDAKDDDGMVAALAATPYAIGYASFIYADKLARARLGIAAMRSRSDEFLLPDVRTIAASAAALTLRIPADMRLTQVEAPGTGCYPLVNYEYAVVATRQRSPEAAAALRDFLNWAISRDPASFERLAAAHLVGLPSSTWLKSLAQIDLIR